MSVIVWGVPNEPPVRMVAEALDRLGADVITIRPGGIGQAMRVAVPGIDGEVTAGDRRIALSDVSGVYVRPVAPESVPELAGLPETSAEMLHARRIHDLLTGFTEMAPDLTGCRVANRLSSMASNGSKPYQAQFVGRHGFSTPNTLISSDPREVLEFAGAHRELVYKSSSGIRSVVSAFDPVRDRGRLKRLRWCPVQFQERIIGPDVRVHVVGRQVFSAAVDSTAVDYRYARSQVGVDARLRPVALDDDVAARCVALAADLDLPFAGIDLKLADDGRIVCFEVNPSPGFSWYETEAGLPISAAVARWLLGGSAGR